LEDLRFYFKEDALIDNGIPTVNPDLTPNVTRVLSNAQLNSYDTSFKTIALRHTDMVLLKMNREDWGIKNYSPLESLVHAHHMSELWERSKVHYANFVERPPSDEVCSCVKAIESNGVMAELQLLALKIKFPGLTSGDRNLPYGKNGHSKGIKPTSRFRRYGLSYGLGWSRAKKGTRKDYMSKLRNFDFNGDEEDVVDRVMTELIDGDKGLQKHLTDVKAWKNWKKGFKRMDDAGNYQFAMFIYCMLN